MIIVQEKKLGREIYYEVEYQIDNKIVNTNEIYYRGTTVDVDGKLFLMLYDNDMNPVSDVFQFLNCSNYSQSINSKIKALQALKFLYSYQSIFNKNIEDFTASDIEVFKLFLKGNISKGNTISFENLTSRSNETVNAYLSIYRNYLNFLGKENKVLFETKTVTTSIIAAPDCSVEEKSKTYTSNEKTITIDDVPDYISVEDFGKIIDEIRKNYTVRDEIIVRLMFECGLRLGEVLGITNDDFVRETINGEEVAVLYIRNRISDKPYQQAKTCMKVHDIKQYQSKEYNLKDWGYQTVFVDEDLEDLILDYINEEHVKARKNHKSNYYSSTIADRVRKTTSDDVEDINYYLFINSLGKPLSKTVWNYLLRDIFIACGIPVDKGNKKHNLSHRFRHGFAMFYVKELGYGVVELKEVMRHRSLSSVACYTKHTSTDKTKIKTDFVTELKTLLPALHRS